MTLCRHEISLIFILTEEEKVVKGTLDRISTCTGTLSHTLFYSTRSFSHLFSLAPGEVHERPYANGYLSYAFLQEEEKIVKGTLGRISTSTDTLSFYLRAHTFSLFLSPLGEFMKDPMQTDISHMLFCRRRRRL